MTNHDAVRKQRIMDYIAATIRARGYPPSVREIAKAVGLASTSAVHHHLRSSRRRATWSVGGPVARDPPDAHGGADAGPGPGARAPVEPSETHALPIIGEIAAGGPIEAYQDVRETLAVPDMLAPAGEAYVLRVRGDSMIEAHIADGDFVVIRQQDTARDGDIVVAQVEENAVTLKRFFREKERIRLQPANPNYPPKFYPRCGSRESSSGSSGGWTECSVHTPSTIRASPWMAGIRAHVRGCRTAAARRLSDPLPVARSSRAP